MPDDTTTKITNDSKNQIWVDIFRLHFLRWCVMTKSFMWQDLGPWQCRDCPQIKYSWNVHTLSFRCQSSSNRSDIRCIYDFEVGEFRPVSKKITRDLLLDRANCVRDQGFIRDKEFQSQYQNWLTNLVIEGMNKICSPCRYDITLQCGWEF